MVYFLWLLDDGPGFLKSIQNKIVSEIKLGEIVEILKFSTNKKIKIEYERIGIIKTLDITLKRQL